MTNIEDFVRAIVHRVPELAPTLAEHVADNGVVLPHVFMADVARFAIAEAANPEKHFVLQALLDHLNGGLQHGTAEVQELVVVSFVENLIGEERAVGALQPLLKPSLKAAVDEVCR